MNSYRTDFYKHIEDLQDKICAAIENLDSEANFQEDLWKRDGGGGGRTRILANGKVIEKGGVNISGVHGRLPETMTKYLGVKHDQFFACGISLVLHPINPMVPTVHANFRYFELYDEESNVVDQWFAGGADMTPYYIFDEDVKHFHGTWKEVCDRYDSSFYPKYKEACDTYFYNSHREEARGIGGVFFDYLRPTNEHSGDFWHSFTKDASESFLQSFLPIAEKRKDLDYSDQQREWQEIRRGRYVEFNLIHDKGTLFGLKTKGRIESIFMSLPPKVQWSYNYPVDAGSEEERLVTILKNPVNWVEK